MMRDGIRHIEITALSSFTATIKHYVNDEFKLLVDINCLSVNYIISYIARSCLPSNKNLDCQYYHNR